MPSSMTHHKKMPMPMAQGPSASMDPPTAPGPRSSTSNAPSTPSGRQRTFERNTPRASNSPFPPHTPRTPGGSLVKSCTTDELLFARVSVRTAKCTECDKRNKDTMRRCPGCTFQVCQPCYERRERLSRDLIHGNMGTLGAVAGSASGSTGRTVRQKPQASTPGSGSSDTKKVAEDKEVDDEAKSIAEEQDALIPVARDKKRASRKKPRVQDSGLEESTEDDFEPDLSSPISSKRRRTALTFAESALATATRTPPATRAARRPHATGPTPLCRAPLSARSDTDDPQTSIGYRPSEPVYTDILYENGIKGYDEPLLGRHELVMSNPIAMIPAIVKRNGKRLATPEEIHKEIQDKTRQRMQDQTRKRLQEESFKYITTQRASYSRPW
ncbi:hypothetical protein EJ02DRAFT_457438 [Clathrospora elynae]|uniref:Uncharacterized protein n=1 Tax=Clathrospora elynae TaxID=706981 RepID=A0A6A5SGF3_9PLEO|nr:hypothetical protein EJ02DRAFT_457438 [Clathrospora elynae]